MAGSARAYAPSTITNFFSVRRGHGAKDLRNSGATGGGFIVSRGVITEAIPRGASGRGRVEVVVDGNPDYEAKTSRTAVQLLLEGAGRGHIDLTLNQQMQVPIGYGFGASAASAISAVYATAAAVDIDLPKEALAAFAHDAEIIQQTGLGTVSAAYDAVGAGAVVVPGSPGIARFMNVRIDGEVRVVTGSLAPYVKSDLLGSEEAVARLNRFGDEALARVVADPRLETLASAGEWFADGLGLMRPEVRELVNLAKRSGAAFASQNMVGHAMHAIVPLEKVQQVTKALASSPSRPRVDVLEIGTRKAGVVEESRRR